MTSLLTCKEFLQELTDYLDSTVDVELRRKLEAHIGTPAHVFINQLGNLIQERRSFSRCKHG